MREENIRIPHYDSKHYQSYISKYWRKKLHLLVGLEFLSFFPYELLIWTCVMLVDNWLISHEEYHKEIKANPIKSKLNWTTIFIHAERLSADREFCLYNFFSISVHESPLSFFSIFLTLDSRNTRISMS